MSNSAVVRQFIVDTTGKQIGVILPIEEYQALVRLQVGFTRRPRRRTRPALEPLYGALRHLGGAVAPTAEMDAIRRELWAAWDGSGSS